MDKIVKAKDSVYRIRFDYNNKNYYLEKRMGRWYNRHWATILRTINKTIFIKIVSKELV